GIRDFHVTGVQTCALPIYFLALATLAWGLVITGVLRNWIPVTGGNTGFGSATGNRIPPLTFLGDPIRGDREYYVLVWGAVLLTRSEERRVGRECRYRCNAE